jgi:PAS domain S-box-containing protein
MNANKLRTSFAIKSLAFQVVGFGLILTIVGVLQYRSIRSDVYDEVENAGRSAAQSIKEMLNEHPQMFTSQALKPVVLRFYHKLSNIEHVSVVDRASRIIADSDPTLIGTQSTYSQLLRLLNEPAEDRSLYERDGQQYLRLSYAVEGPYEPTTGSTVMGVIIFDLRLSVADGKINRTFANTMLTIAGMLLAFWVLQYVLINRGFLRRLKKLTRTAKRFGKGDLAARANISHDDETGQMARAFNHMAHEVQTVSEAARAEIAERKLAQAALFESEARYRSLIENIPDVTWTCDSEYHTTFISPNVAKVYGFTAEEICRNGKKLWLDRIHPDDLETVLAGFEALFSTSTRFDIEYRIKRADGRWLWVHDRAVATRKVNGGVYADGIFTDITERRQIEAELERARDTALESVQLKSEFLSNIGHELRTPMNGILGMAELTLMTVIDDEQREYLTLLRSAGHTLLTLINDIIEFSTIESGQLAIETSDFYLRSSVADMIRRQETPAQEKQLDLIFQVASDVPDGLVGDPGRLRQIMDILLGNAIKFTPAGEIAVRVVCESQTDNQATLQFSISDTGVGIPAEKQALIFEAFTQADGSASRRFGGTGLGLAICVRLVVLLGGRIWVESEVERGSTFHFTLTYGVHVDPLVCPAAVPLISAYGLRVLIADAHGTSRRVLEEMLTGWHMSPTTVASGEAVLVALKQATAEGNPFNMVLLDGSMPDMDGFTVAEQIRLTPTLAETKIILLVSTGLRGEAALCKQLRISAYLVKPIMDSYLLDAILMAHNAPEISGSSPALITRHSLRESAESFSALPPEDQLLN